MNLDKVDETNFVIYAAANYDNPQCYQTLEFHDDLKRFSYLRRLFKRYDDTGDIKEKLVINHIVVLYNVFGNDVATKLLFYRLEEYLHFLKPFLILMGHLPEKVYGIGSSAKTIITSDIPMDDKIINILRKI